MTEQADNSKDSGKRTFRTIHFQRNDASNPPSPDAPPGSDGAEVPPTPPAPPAAAPLATGSGRTAPAEETGAGPRPKLRLKSRAGGEAPPAAVRRHEPASRLRPAPPEGVTPAPPAPEPERKVLSSTQTTVITGLSLGGVKPPVAHDLPPAAVNPPQPAPAPRPAPAPPPKKAEPGPATETTILPLEGTTRLPQMPPPGREPAGRPRLQSRPAATSPSGPPPVPPAPPRPSPAGGIVALLLALAGEALTQAPAWTAWFRGGAFPRQQAVTLALALLVLGILILSRQRTLTIIAGVILAFMILMCAAQIALPRLGMTAGLLSDDVVSRLASTGQCILAAGLFAASLVLLTGQRLAHWTLAALAVVVTAVGSFVDLGPPLPVARAPAQAESRREATPPVVAEKVRLPLSVPAGWVAVTDKGRLAEAQADDLYQCGTEDLQIAVRHFAARPPGMTLDNYAGQLYQQRSAESAALKTFVSKTKVSGKPNQRRLAVLADKRTDVLVVEQNGQLFTVTVVGGKESFRAHEGEIKQILGAVE